MFVPLELILVGGGGSYASEGVGEGGGGRLWNRRGDGGGLWFRGMVGLASFPALPLCVACVILFVSVSLDILLFFYFTVWFSSLLYVSPSFSVSR